MWRSFKSPWLAFVTIWSIAVPHEVFAEPGPVVTYLMNTEASLFSFGMYRLNENVEELESTHAAFFSAAYDWDANRIEVSAFSYQRGLEPTQANCRKLITAMRQRAAVDEEGKPILGSSLYAQMFLPIGYELKNAPDEQVDKIDQIIVVKATIHVDKNTRIACEGPLLSNKVLFESKK